MDNIPVKILNSIQQTGFFDNEQCEKIEAFINETVQQAENGIFKEHTVDKAPLRNKYFFGEGYTYGSKLSRRGPGMERLYPQQFIDPIPKWIETLVINPLINAGIVEAGFINSAVINDYQKGGCIVSHIDPPQIFARPIISISFFNSGTLCFGCKFQYKPIRVSKPLLQVPLPRGFVTLLSGFSANNVTHCIRPEDTTSRRAAIILRKVLPSAPRLTHIEMTELNWESVNNIVQPNVVQKINKKYSKSKGSKLGIVKKSSIVRKTFFPDNRKYINKPFFLEQF